MFPSTKSAVTSREILREKSVGQFSILPSLSLFTNCIIWSWYGYLLGDMTVMLPNLSGTLFGALYSAIYLKYATTTQAPWLLASATVISATTIAALSIPTEHVLPYIGLTGDVLAVILMASPLVTIRTVLAEKSTKSLPFPTSLVSLPEPPRPSTLNNFD